MVDLFSYFISNYNEKKLGIYEKYNNEIIENELNGNGVSLKVYDAEDAFSKLKELIIPANTYSSEICIDFILICYYLYSLGYFITDFPNYLNRPTDLVLFANNDIKEKARQIYGVNYKGSVTWESRRNVIANLTLSRNKEGLIETKPHLDDIFKKISNRNASFCSMEKNEKLQEICNVIENMLKIKGEFVNINYKENTFDIIEESDVIGFRKLTQCFRHATEESLAERKNFSEEQKDFCINYGLTICEVIYNSIKQRW